VLLDEHAWEISRKETRTSLGLPETPQAFVVTLQEELDAAYARTLEGLRGEHPIFQVAHGAIDLRKLDALDEPASLKALRGRVEAMLPDADLPELLLEIAARARFTEAFTHEREPSARLTDLDVSICAALIAQACNVGYKPLIDESVPALRLERLKYVARHYIRPETLIAANARIVDYHARLPLALEWGGGEVASIDGLRFVVPRETIHARRNPRYFHRRRGITALGTTADHYAGIHTIVVPGTQRDGLYLLDGLLDPQTSVHPQQIMSDTAGYSDIMFGLFPAARLPVLPTARRHRRRPVPADRRHHRLRQAQSDRNQPDRHAPDHRALRRPPPRRRQPAATGHHRFRADALAAQPHPTSRDARPSARRRRPRVQDRAPARLLQRPRLPSRDPRTAQPR
jgi:hypothetical protein